MTDEAVSMYLISLQKKSSNVDAQIQLKQTGKRVMDALWADFYVAYTAEEHKKAVYAYRKANSLHDRINKYVRLDRPPYYEEHYKVAKEDYMDELYVEAQDLLASEEFESANSLFNEISALDPTYKDVHDMRKTTKAEPIYREAEEAMLHDEYRKAYYLYSDVLEVSSTYKEVKSKQLEALDKASFTIAIMPLKKEGATVELTNKFYSLVTDEVLKMNSPFIKVIDRSLTEKILAEQKLALSGLVDEATAAKAGMLTGSKAVLNGSIVSVKKTQKPIASTRKPGWEAYSVKKYNRETRRNEIVTRYKKVFYKESYGESAVTIDVQFSLISSETGEVLLSDVVSRGMMDKVNYVSYKGNQDQLFAGYWKWLLIPDSQDQVYSDRGRKAELNAKLRTRKREFVSDEVLKLQLLENISANIAGKINAYEKTR